MSLENLKVLILCGGRGERLKPLTDGIPKPLVHIKGKPILYYLISYFKKHSITNFIIAAGYKSEMINNYLIENYNNINIEFVDSGDVDIISRIIDCKNYIINEFILCYGDTLADIDLPKLYNFHYSHLGKVTVSSYRQRSQFGILSSTNSGMVTSFKEKPLLDAWINIGYFIFDPDALTNINEYNSFVEFLESLIKEHELYTYKHEGLHITVNTIKELAEAEKNIGDFK